VHGAGHLCFLRLSKVERVCGTTENSLSTLDRKTVAESA